MNSLNDICHCEDGVLSSAHGNFLAEETVSAAVKLQADRLLVRPLEGRWLCPHLPRAAFAVGSRCLLGIVPLVFSILTQCCTLLRCLVMCGHCRAPRWRMAV
ncbi:surface protease GP63 [Trypanosoma cruzi]|nr:surface protease GP63 [Trypanosoma cruzi]